MSARPGEWLLFFTLLGAGSLVLLVTTIAPHRRRTREFVERAAALDAEVERLRADNARLSSELAALETDPWIVERELRHRTGFLRPGEQRLSR